MTDEPVESIPGYSGLVRIGMGGSGVVFRARQLAFDRDVAVKVLRGDFDESARRRFLREARLTGRLTGHPNVVTALDAGTTESGHPYLAMDLFERGSLQDRLTGSGPFPSPEVASIGAKIAAALSDAHALGMVHRDVKPNNILVSRFGEPALADFGVAVVPDGATVVTMFNAFTPHHAAPEVINGADATPLSDVYSLGSTLYHLLTGHPPFAGEDNGADLSALLYRIVNSPPPALNCPELPGLAEIAMRALSKNATERPESAAAMAAELRELVGAGARLTTTALTMPPLTAADPTHPAQAEGVGPAFAGAPGVAVGPNGTVIGEQGAGEVTVPTSKENAGSQGPGFEPVGQQALPQLARPQAPPSPARPQAPAIAPAGPSVAGFEGFAGAPATEPQPPTLDPKRSAAGFEAPPPEEPVDLPQYFHPEPVERERRRRPLIIGASAAAALAVAVGAIAVAQGSSSGTSAGGTRSGAALGPGGRDDSGQPMEGSSSRAGGQDVAAGGPLPTSGSSSSVAAGTNQPSQSGAPGSSGAVGAASSHAPTSAPGSTAAPTGQTTGAPSASGSTTASKPPSSSSPKPPTTSSSSKNMSCTGWHITHVVADDGSGYAASGTFNMRSGPYSACSATGKFTTGQHMYIWCHVTNGYNNVWVYGRIDGTDSPAWQSLDNFKSGATLGPAC